MLHEPASQGGKDYAQEYKTRLGVWLFLVYAGVYFVGFVGINVFKPTLMEKTVLLGLNVAVVFGFGLIVSALVLALIYNHLCSKRECEMKAQDTNGEGE